MHESRDEGRRRAAWAGTPLHGHGHAVHDVAQDLFRLVADSIVPVVVCSNGRRRMNAPAEARADCYVGRDLRLFGRTTTTPAVVSSRVATRPIAGRTVDVAPGTR